MDDSASTSDAGFMLSIMGQAKAAAPTAPTLIVARYRNWRRRAPSSSDSGV
jgi:hypothetical protein